MKIDLNEDAIDWKALARQLRVENDQLKTKLEVLANELEATELELEEATEPAREW